MFERFTDRARQVVVLAADEARALGHDYIGTEHFLLGLLIEKEGLAARALRALGMTVDEVRARVVGVVGRGESVTLGQIPFTAQAVETFNLATANADAMRHGMVGTEHLLLGLVDTGDENLEEIVSGLGAGTAEIRARLLAMVSGSA